MSVQSSHPETLSQGPLAILPKEKQLSEFIDKLLELTLCPINMTIFKNPVVTMNGNLFEEDKLYKWLNDNKSTCPLTRSILVPDNIRVCHTMKRLVDMMKSHDISYDFVKEMITEMNENGQRKVSVTLVEGPTLAEDHPPEIIKAATQQSSTQVRKARRKKDNRKIKKKLNKKMSLHTANLRHHGYQLKPQVSYAIKTFIFNVTFIFSRVFYSPI